jgi:outer membrane biosynthesis protein TonB
MSESGKILRIGVIQNGKVIEERKIPRRVTVSVGSGASNDFVVQGEAVPENWPLFEIKNGEYELVFTESMGGHINVGDDKVPLKKVRADGLANPDGEKFRYKLSDASRGRVQLSADVSILFHFTKPAVAAAKPELPASVAVGFFANIEPFFTGVLTTSFVIHAIFTLMVVVADRTIEPPSREDVLKYIAKVKPPKIEAKVPTVPVELPGDKPADAPKKKEPAGDGGKKGKPDKGSGNDADRRREVRQAVAGKALAAIIGAAGGDSGSAVANVFGSGTAIGGDLQNAISGTAGVGVAGSGDLTRRGGGTGGEGSAAGIDNLGTSGGGRVTGGTKKKTRVRGSARVGEIAPVDGTVDKRGVARSIRRRQNAFQACYEAALKSNSKLKGKLVVEFTINRRGRVSDAAVIRDGLGSSQVSRCVIGVLKRIRFPAPDDGEVTISNSFVFQPNN